ncbi:MAG: hypothetical protein IKB38_02480 [Clostridia bacterium]|nr:hypothetical protein [Clostridia bacterium]
MLDVKGVNSDEFLEYKGRPLVRQGDDIYYGDLSDKYHVYMMIMTEKNSSKSTETVPGTIMVQLINGATKAPEKQQITNGLAEAFEFAEAWLVRYNK